MPAAKELPPGGAVENAAVNAVANGAKAASSSNGVAAAAAVVPTSSSTSSSDLDPHLDRDYERVLSQLGTLISGRSRGDGRAWEWEHAMEVMALCLERAGLVAAAEEQGVSSDNGAAAPSSSSASTSVSSRSVSRNQLNKLRVIHVTGTKGKGSTCAMTESILRGSGYSTGLFTSPHLWDVRERIRVNGRPVDKRVFITAFDDLWAKLEARADERVGVPAYFKFLTLLGLKIFVEAGLDVVVLEVGIGGRLDATNCVPPPVAAGFTPLGFDHLELLGNTLPLIATEKSGIIKAGSSACLVVAGQPPDAGAVLVGAAARAGVPFALAPPLTDFKVEGAEKGGAVALSLSGEHQRVNASLAVALSGAFDSWVASLLEKAKVDDSGGKDESDDAETFHARHFSNASFSTSSSASASASATAATSSSLRAAALRSGTLPLSYAQGLQRCVWHGRAQVVVDESVQAPSSLSFYLDGAHTPESSVTCANWFAEAVGSSLSSSSSAAAAAPPSSSSSSSLAAPPGELRLLLFNCMHEREPLRLLAPLSQTLASKGLPLAGAVFVPPDSTYAKLGPSEESASAVDLSWQQGLAQLWRENFAVAASGKEARGCSSSSSGGAAATESAAATAAASSAAKFLPPLSTAAGAAGAGAANAAAPTGAVAPSVRSALEWLRSATRASPGLKMRVLVTGSLYLVGDVLRHLGKNEE